MVNLGKLLLTMLTLILRYYIFKRICACQIKCYGGLSQSLFCWSLQRAKGYEDTKYLLDTLKAEKEELESMLGKEKLLSLQLKQELSDAENRHSDLYKVIMFMLVQLSVIDN